MNKSDILNMLEIENWNDVQYYEQFLLLIEHLEKINEDILIEVFSNMDSNECKSYIEFYFNDLMTGIPDDNMDLYKIFSSVKLTLCEAASAINKDARAVGNLAYEILRFQQWLTEGKLLVRTNTSNHTENMSIYDALLSYRMNQLNVGKYNIIVPDDFEYAIYDYEYDVDEYSETILVEDEDYNDFQEEDEYKGLIDEKNPLIEEIK